MPQPRVIFVNRFYWPEQPATAQLLTDLAESLAAAGLSVSVITAMFALTYLPQLAILAFVDGPLAIFNTVLLVLSESSAVIMFGSQMSWMADARSSEVPIP